MHKTLNTQRHKALIALLTKQRQAIGMSQAQLAQQLGEFQSFIARLESGQRRVDVVEFLELATALNLDPLKAIKIVAKAKG